MGVSSKNKSICIIGAGPSGITAAKHLLQVGITNFKVYDKNNQVGGNWIYSPEPGHSSVYETAHIISSKRFSQYHDFPMPEDYPDYPSHKLLLKYFQDYADHFGVTKYIQFNTEVINIEYTEDKKWKVILTSKEHHIFDYLILANGHHWDPRYPNYPGEFSGEFIHSHYYKTHLNYKNKRVLIVGGGNSASDIAVDICRHAEYTALSWRRGYYIVPKLIFGQPPDVINARSRFLPKFISRRLFKLLWRIIVGGNKKYGLQEPDHDILQSHPILNTKLLDHLRHGDITPKKDIKKFEGKKVIFIDNTEEEFDTVIVATGYKISIPFIDKVLLSLPENEFPLYLKVFHPKFNNLAFIGYVQPQGCIWPLSDTQSQIVANQITGRYKLPQDIDKKIEEEVKHIKKTYTLSPRHSTEVNYHRYQKKLFKEVPKEAPNW